MSDTVQITENSWTGQHMRFAMCHGSDPSITSLKPYGRSSSNTIRNRSGTPYKLAIINPPQPYFVRGDGKGLVSFGGGINCPCLFESV